MNVQGLLQELLSGLGIISQPQLVPVKVPFNPPKEQVMGDQLLVVGKNGYRKWVHFNCPCKCGEVISLPLMKNQKPRWQVSFDIIGRPTLFPSVHRMDGCKSHFWIKKGVIFWCND